MFELKQACLRKVAVFGALSTETLSFILQRSEQLHFERGDIVFREGDDADAMFVIEEGKVAIVKNWRKQQYVLHDLSAGDAFGEMSLIDMHTRSASVFIIEPSQLLRITTSTILALYQQDLEQFALLQMNLGREVSRRLRATDERLFQWRVAGEPEQELKPFDALAN